MPTRLLEICPDGTVVFIKDELWHRDDVPKTNIKLYATVILAPIWNEHSLYLTLDIPEICYQRYKHGVWNPND
jgi:hypothetical protein